jgi:hypothetical protein
VFRVSGFGVSRLRIKGETDAGNQHLEGYSLQSLGFRLFRV